jgi:prepilin-type N-terminal cleavage/methylation domain-containing protein
MLSLGIRQRQQCFRRQRGMSLVELMVGITIGLFIVAAASLLVGNQLTDNRRLLLETQLQQDMRATMDIMTRQIRRAGTVDQEVVQNLVANDPGLVVSRDIAKLLIELPNSENLTVNYFLNFDNRSFVFRREMSPSGTGVIKSIVGGGGPQDLTDPNAVNVTVLRFELIEDESQQLPCPKLCAAPSGPTDCWPTVRVRTLRVTLDAQAASDATVRRSMQSEVRIRNDYSNFKVGAAPEQACP